MGTRNVTSVILDGKQMVCQYGQWDGYPTYTGVKILEFLQSCDMEHFKKALNNTTIHVSNYHEATTYTGSTKQINELVNKVFDTQCKLNEQRKADEEYINGYAAVRHLVEQKEITEKMAEDYLVSTRDTGCEILKLIYDRSLEKQPLELFALEEEYKGDYSWDIQGIYVLDLDKNVLKMTFDGYTQTLDMSRMPTEIDREMLIFENATRMLYELGYRPRKSNNPVEHIPINEQCIGLYQQASEIAVKLGEEIKTEYPELLSSPDEEIKPENYGQKLIFGFLCEKNGITQEDRDSFEKSIAKPALEDRIQSATNRASGAQAVVSETVRTSEPEI